MNSQKIKVAAFESIELALSDQKRLAALQFSTEAATLWRFLVGSDLLDYQSCGVKGVVSEDCQLFTRSSITAILQLSGVDAVYLGGHSSPELERWAKRAQIGLTSLPYKLQRLLEDKIHFDRLLKKNKIASPHSLVVRNSKQLAGWQSYPAVLQLPCSHGGLGTFIVSNAALASKLIQQKRLKYPLLLREFAAGIPCGVTLVLSKRRMLVSALRAQCSLTDRGSENFYYGIQWIPSGLFKSTVIRKVNHCIEDLANLMRAQGVCGAVHFDLMISEAGASVIECNPRPSGACPQLGLTPELFHHLDFPYEHTKASLGGELSADRAAIPRSKYDGCTLDFDFLLPQIKLGWHKRAALPAGWRDAAARNSAASRQRRSFIYPYHPKGSALTRDHTLGVYISPQPFFTVTTSKLDFRAGAERQLRALARFFL